jgi:tetratricopeptide (TPR) repeat protein
VRRTGGFATAALLVLAATAGPVRAQERDPRELEAKTACLAGRTDRGIELLAELYAETNDPTYIYNQGRCYQQTGKPREALTRFREYLRKAPTASAEDKALVQGYIAELEEQIKTTPAPDLSARQPADNQVLVSKTQADETPPIYKRWWFWTGVGVVVIGAVATTVALTRPSDPTVYMGNLDPGTIAVPSR